VRRGARRGSEAGGGARRTEERKVTRVADTAGQSGHHATRRARLDPMRRQP
jgi:hypothetical protein